jgi:single-stranded DNA-binding protein
MINKTVLKGVITYKGMVRTMKNKDKPTMEFGLSYNSLTKVIYMNNIICSVIGSFVRIVDENLSIGDTVMIVGFLTTVEINLKSTTVLNVESLEPLTTKKNIMFRDDGVDTEVFDKYIYGFDINR